MRDFYAADGFKDIIEEFNSLKFEGDSKKNHQAPRRKARIRLTFWQRVRVLFGAPILVHWRPDGRVSYRIND